MNIYDKINYEVGKTAEEEAWARRLGFDNAHDYWEATREAFAEWARYQG